MKKAFAVFSVLFSIILVIPLFAYATDSPTTEAIPERNIGRFDAEYIEADILQELKKLEVGPYDKIIKIHNIPFRWAFYDYDTIEEVLNSSYNSQTIYAIVANNQVIDAYLIKKGVPLAKAVEDIPKSLDLSFYFDETIIRRVSPDIEVHHAYYLSGTSNLQGNALYYETNMGDFVYYHYSGKYLMPASAFVDFMRFLYSQREAKHVPGTLGSFADSKQSDFDVYRIHSSAFDPSTWNNNLNTDLNNQKPDNQLKTVMIISSSAVVIAAAAVTVILWKRKKA